MFVRYLTGDDPRKAEACRAVFERVANGDEEVVTIQAIVTEVVYVLSSPRIGYRQQREAIRDGLSILISLPGLHLAEKPLHLRALEIYAQFPAFDFEDALSVAAMEAAGITEIYSYDTDFDRFPGVRRLEP